MRLVLDTSVLVAAIRSNQGASSQLLQSALERRFVLLLSVPLMIEYEAVLTRPEHLTASGLTASEVGALTDAIAAVAEPVHLSFLWRPMLRDPDDDMVLEAAVNGGVDALVTFNLRDFDELAKGFDIAVLTPKEALGRIGKR
ncbi:putative toxin-antitoxin system toxin component, PIN family [Paracidobacterium acidisoli]|uniref:Putative toxin-antitoxin system toxin component, PIN family n=1 Tax=Paracidobacterium acidisoli TaxID=2303751 RepID=A0A372IPB5_9BACT|nr:putative toxin-antitoxin system toxin component, PIN family [Paracidobacterium acidisoli]MBT9331111.1 putative toxin-antitoxin system toxin component, PIN family [Paracidobacterium acidisoli]